MYTNASLQARGGVSLKVNGSILLGSSRTSLFNPCAAAPYWALWIATHSPRIRWQCDHRRPGTEVMHEGAMLHGKDYQLEALTEERIDRAVLAVRSLTYLTGISYTIGA